MHMPVLSRAHAARVHALKTRRHREENGLFLAEGLRVIEDLFASALVIDSVVVSPSLEDSERGRALLARLQAVTTVHQTSDVELRQLADTETPQGVLAVVRIPERRLPETLPEDALVVVLDAVQDPGNFGTIVRGADAFGAAAVLALPGTVDFWNGKAVRAAAGSSFRVPLIRCMPADLAEWSTRQQLPLWGADAAGDDVASTPIPRRVALVLGNEGAGLSAHTEPLLERRIALPIRGGAESLNVAMAGTVLMYLLSERR